jgi:hypothetical protein
MGLSMATEDKRICTLGSMASEPPQETMAAISIHLRKELNTADILFT